MNWQDTAVILSVRPFGERRSRVSLLTSSRGREAGLSWIPTAKNGGSAVLQVGNIVFANWSGRLEESLGCLKLDLLEHTSSPLFDQPLALEALSAACSLLDCALPQGQACAGVWSALLALISALRESAHPSVYVHWEAQLLADLGYGLDLSCCAVTGEKGNLIYVSPKSGRAVSRDIGWPYRDRLLVLPDFLRGVPPSPEGHEVTHTFPLPEAVCQGFELTGYFLQKHVLHPIRQGFPPSRRRLLQRIASSRPSVWAFSQAPVTV